MSFIIHGRVFDRVLSAGDIQHLFACHHPGSPDACGFAHCPLRHSSSKSYEELDRAELISLLRRQQDRLRDADDTLRRMGYGECPIYVFHPDEARPLFTSYVGDVAWDTKKNRKSTFDFITNAIATLLELRTKVRELEEAGQGSRQP